jgi:hypothetical protein
MNFKKINMDLSDLNLLDFNSGVCLHNPNRLGLSYYRLKTPDQQRLLQARLPAEYQNKPVTIFYCIMTGPGKLLPHVDTHTTTAINYYIKAANGITTFYKGGVAHPNIQNSFLEESLKQAESFIAKDNECFVLNVSNIHNVELLSTESRHFINFAFKDTL